MSAWCIWPNQKPGLTTGRRDPVDCGALAVESNILAVIGVSWGVFGSGGGGGGGVDLDRLFSNNL